MELQCLVCKTSDHGLCRAPVGILQGRDIAVWNKFLPFMEDCSLFLNFPEHDPGLRE